MFATQTLIQALRIGSSLTVIALLGIALGLVHDFETARFVLLALFAIVAIFFFRLHNHRLAITCAIAAFLFSPYNPISLPRHIWIIADLLAGLGLAYATFWATSPYKKGTRFEDYVATLFPEPNFVIKDRTRDTGKHSNRRVESDGHPDFVFRAVESGNVFAVECKWRSRWARQPNGGQGIWWNLAQFDRYAAYQRDTGIPVFVAFGIGGSPSCPAEIHILELDRLRFPFLSQSLLRSGNTPAHMQHRLH
jgi:hypothetical protein